MLSKKSHLDWLAYGGCLMYSVLIVEGKEIERASLMSIVAQSMLHLNTIYEAKDGLEAISQYAKYHPDIVVLDIQLPFMNGLQCVRQIKQLAGNHRVRFIIQTAYDRFSYAQESIQIGISHYLLKPVNPQVIINSIASSIDQLLVEKSQYEQTSKLLHNVQHMRNALAQDCIQLILANRSEIMIQKTLALLHMTMKNGFCIVIANYKLTFDQQQQLKDDIADLGYFSLMCESEHSLTLFFLYMEEIHQEEIIGVKHLLEGYRMFDHPIGVGHIVNHAGKLYRSYIYAKSHVRIQSCCEFHIYKNNLKKSEEVSGKEIIDWELWALKILHYYEVQDDQHVHEEIHKLVEYVLPLHPTFINQQITDFLLFIQKTLEKKYKLDYTNSNIEIFTVKEEDKYQTLEVRMLYTLHTLLTPVRYILYQDISHVTKRALKFIKNNYGTPISLHDVSHQLAISPFYLSKLLNGELNKTFTDLVNAYRIDEAKILLREHHSVKETASIIGFRSAGYFSKIFKKSVGITPTEYHDIFVQG